MKTDTCYLAGPMRGYPRFNFDAFFDAEEQLTKWGWIVHSPARHDIEEGFDPNLSLEENDFDFKAAMTWDLEMVLASDCVFVLPGWEVSEGARLEVATALTTGVPVFTYVGGSPVEALPPLPAAAPTVEPDVKSPETEVEALADWELNLLDDGGYEDNLVVREAGETVTDEAYRLVYGDRGVQYGPPDADFRRTGQMWGALLDEWRSGSDPDVPPKLVALCMVALKLSREVHRPKRDNLVDAIGYVLCAHRVETGE